MTTEVPVPIYVREQKIVELRENVGIPRESGNSATLPRLRNAAGSDYVFFIALNICVYIPSTILLQVYSI